MSNLKSNFTVKLIAVVLFAVFLTVTVLSTACIVFGFVTGAFVPENERTEYKNDLSKGLLHDSYEQITVALRAYTFTEDKNDFSFDDYNIVVSENVVYEIKDSNGKLIYSNKNAPTGDVYLHRICEVFKQDGSEYIVYESVPSVEFTEDSTYVYETVEPTPIAIYGVSVYIVENLTAKDNFWYLPHYFELISDNAVTLFTVDLLSIIATIGLCIFILCSAGHKEGKEEIHISRFDKFPIDIITAIYVGLTSLLVCGIVSFIIYYGNEFIYADSLQNSLSIGITVLLIIGIVIDFILLAVLLMTTAVRLKTKSFIKSSLIYMALKLTWKIIKCIFKFTLKIIKGFFRGTGNFISKIPLVWKTILGIIALALYELFFIFFINWDEAFILLFIGANIVLLVGLLILAMQLRNIKDTTKDIANGNIYKKIDTKHMFMDIKEHAENINNINDGIANAVQERMKSERFKTELITNVSHDIKTPLTSIINYVDLLEKEEIDNETAKEYINVLSRQSTRLKKLIEDLLEASKASTGNISVNLVKCELGILLSQALGEYDERFAKSNLQIVLNKTEDLLYIMADNRHMWRIFDNILNNIAKYAQPNTRVYIDLNRVNNIVQINFRNISKDELNISGEELMERFVRGDSSRNTEGSGLGLSIAKSLAEVQKGKLDIQIDGDLFKVKLTFPISE